MKPKYEVIWIDDEWDKMTQFKNECEVIHNIYLHPFRTQKAGMEALDSNLSKWDAVLLDAKMFDQSEENEVAKLDGLRKAIRHIDQLPARHRVPYFISTGQPDLMDNETFEQSFGNFYIKEKDDLLLIHDIKETVDNSTRFQIRKMYCDHYEQLLQLNPEVCDDILTILETMHFPDSHPDFKPRYFFNPLRKALEYVFREAQKVDIIPEDFFRGGIVNINQCFMFVIGREAEKLGYKHRDGGITPRHIQDMMSLIINLGNANSHSFEHSHNTELTEEEILNYEDQIKSVGGNSKQLVFSIALQFCEILTWMNNYIATNSDKEDNRKKCVKLEAKDSKDEKDKIDLTGVIELDKGIYHIGTKVCVNPVFVKQREWLGKKVKIVKYGENNNDKTKDKYPYFASNIQLIEESENGSK